MFTILGLSFVAGAIFFSSLIVLGLRYTWIHVTANLFEAGAYFSAAYGLLRYMFHDRYLTKDELFAAGAVFTLLAWGFAFFYSTCQLLGAVQLSDPDLQAYQPWLDLIFLSFSVQSATGLSDIMPVSPVSTDASHYPDVCRGDVSGTDCIPLNCLAIYRTSTA